MVRGDDFHFGSTSFARCTRVALLVTLVAAASSPGLRLGVAPAPEATESSLAKPPKSKPEPSPAPAPTPQKKESPPAPAPSPKLEVLTLAAAPAACSAYTQCKALAGDCCPDGAGTTLDCCKGGLIEKPTPAPKSAPTEAPKPKPTAEPTPSPTPAPRPAAEPANTKPEPWILDFGFLVGVFVFSAIAMWWSGKICTQDRSVGGLVGGLHDGLLQEADEETLVPVSENAPMLEPPHSPVLEQPSKVKLELTPRQIVEAKIPFLTDSEPQQQINIGQSGSVCRLDERGDVLIDFADIATSQWVYWDHIDRNLSAVETLENAAE